MGSVSFTILINDIGALVSLPLLRAEDLLNTKKTIRNHSSFYLFAENSPNFRLLHIKEVIVKWIGDDRK